MELTEHRTNKRRMILHDIIYILKYVCIIKNSKKKRKIVIGKIIKK